MKTTKPKQEYVFHYTREDGSKGRFFRKSAQNLTAQKPWFRWQYPLYRLDKVELDWTGPLMAKLYAKPENKGAWESLQSRAKREHKTLTAVLLDYGDPRQWGKKT